MKQVGHGREQRRMNVMMVVSVVMQGDGGGAVIRSDGGRYVRISVVAGAVVVNDGDDSGRKRKGRVAVVAANVKIQGGPGERWRRWRRRRRRRKVLLRSVHRGAVTSSRSSPSSADG